MYKIEEDWISLTGEMKHVSFDEHRHSCGHTLRLTCRSSDFLSVVDGTVVYQGSLDMY